MYETLEVQKYINRFFGLYKIKIHNCKIFYSESSLQIFVSFYITAKTIPAIEKTLIRNTKKYNKHTQRSRKNQKFKNRLKKSRKTSNNKFCYFHELKLHNKHYLQAFQEILTQSLVKYTKNRVDLCITLQNLNREKLLSRNQANDLKIAFKQLKRFARNSFFKEGLNVLFVSLLKRKSAKILAEFISDQFKLNQFKTYESAIARKDNYFLGFLKQSILLLVKSKTSRISGVKIVIKGRFNKAPRAKTGNIHFGKFSLQSFNSKIDYYQSTAFTINGTFGIKVWLCENN